MEVITGEVSIRQIFQRSNNWKRYLAWQQGQVRDAERYHVSRMLRCRTPQMGLHIYSCRDCGTERFVPHSCKSPFCTSCGKATTNQWCRKLVSDLPAVPFRHLIFTLPWQLRLLIKDNRKALLNMLFRALADALLALALGTPEPLSRLGKRRMKGMRPGKKYRPGFIAVLHTAGSDLKWNPHFHVIIACGGLSPDGSRFVTVPKKSLLSGVELAAEWKRRVITGLRRLEARTDLYKRPLRSDPSRTIEIEPMIRAMEWRRWHVRICQSTETPDDTVHYSCRYTKHPPLGERRLASYKNGYVTFYYKDYYAGGKRKYFKIRELDFIGRLVQHIPEKGARHVRHYGMFSPPRRSKDLPKLRELLGPGKRPTPAPEDWEERRKEGGEKAPLECPLCRGVLVFVGMLFGSPLLIARLLNIETTETIPTPCYRHPIHGVLDLSSSTFQELQKELESVHREKRPAEVPRVYNVQSYN